MHNMLIVVPSRKSELKKSNKYRSDKCVLTVDIV